MPWLLVGVSFLIIELSLCLSLFLSPLYLQDDKKQMLEKATEMIAWLAEHKKSEKEEFDEKLEQLKEFVLPYRQKIQAATKKAKEAAAAERRRQEEEERRKQEEEEAERRRQEEEEQALQAAGEQMRACVETSIGSAVQAAGAAAAATGAAAGTATCTGTAAAVWRETQTFRLSSSPYSRLTCNSVRSFSRSSSASALMNATSAS